MQVRIKYATAVLKAGGFSDRHTAELLSQKHKISKSNIHKIAEEGRVYTDQFLYDKAHSRYLRSQQRVYVENIENISEEMDMFG